MDKMWSTKDLLGKYTRGILFWNQKLNHCTFIYLFILSKMGMISRNIRNFRHPHVWPVYLGSTKRVHRGPKANTQVAQLGIPRNIDLGL